MTLLSTKMILAAAVVAAGLAVGALAATGVRPPDPANGPPEKAPDEGPPKPIRSLRGHTNRVVSVAYSPDGASIATASWDSTARIWDAKTGAEVRWLESPGGQEYDTFHQVAFSPDNAFVVTIKRVSRDEWAVIVWNRRTGEKVHTFPGESFSISSDGRLIACGGYRLIRLYELATGKMVRETHPDYRDEKQLQIRRVTFSPDGKTLVSTGCPPTSQRGDGVERLTIMADVLRVWDVATLKERPSPLNGLAVDRLGVHPIVLSPDGRTLVHTSRHDVILREAATGGERVRLTGHKEEPCEYAFSPDGRTLASGGMDGMVRLWDLPSGKEVGRFGTEVIDASKGGWVLSVAFSPDGRSLVTGGLDKKAHVWDVSRITGRPRSSAERSAEQLEADWKDLAGDAAAGYAALGRLASSPGTAVSFLGKRLEAAAAVDVKPIERLIVALADDEFPVRERATKELRAMGDRAAPSLRKAMVGDSTPEVRRRLEALLARIDADGPSAETVRELRAVEALEAIGGPEARRVLEKLAAGPSGMRLTEEAKASAGRLRESAGFRD